MPGVTAEIALNITASLTGTQDLGTPVFKAATISEVLQFTEGNGALGLADVAFSDTRTLAASATENLDLTGTLLNAFGATVTQAEVCLIYIKAAASNVNNIVIGNVLNGFLGPLGAAGTYTISPGEYYLAASKTGWAVTAGTGDLLKVLNGGAGTAVNYDVVILGRTVVG